MKLKLNARYLMISLYVVFTVSLIYCIGIVITNIIPIINWSKDFLSFAIKILAPLIIGFAIAYIIDPFVELFERSFKKITVKNKEIFMVTPKRQFLARKLGTFCAYLSLIAVLSMFISFFSYSITKEVSFNNLDEMIRLTKNYIDDLGATLQNAQHMLERFDIESEIVEEYVTKFTSFTAKVIEGLGNSTVLFVKNLTVHLTNLLLGIVISIYLSIDKKRFLAYYRLTVKALFETKNQIKIRNFGKDLNLIFSGYIRGQLLDAMIMMVIISVTLYLVGIKFAIIIGIIAGLANLIPYFGPIVAYTGAITMALLSGEPMKAVFAVIALAVVQQIDGSIIGPKLLGDNLNLHPLFVLLAVVIGGSLYGIFGMLLAVPVAAVIKLTFKRFIEGRLQEKNEMVDEGAGI